MQTSGGQSSGSLPDCAPATCTNLSVNNPRPQENSSSSYQAASDNNQEATLQQPSKSASTSVKDHDGSDLQQSQPHNQEFQPPHRQHYQQNNQQQQQHGYHQNRPGHFNKSQYHYQNKAIFGNNGRGDNESNINHVLLITVYNPHYPITCDIIHQVCNNYGKVNRIVIFKKNGVQAMVEFENVNSARRAKSMLQGYEIYNGCCTLRVEYAKPTRLNIYKNDQDSFDYTNPNLGAGPMDPAAHEHQVGGQPTVHSNSRPYSSSHAHQHSTHPHAQHHGLNSRNADSNMNGVPTSMTQQHQQHYHAQQSSNQHHLLPMSSSTPRVGQTHAGSAPYGPHDQSTDAFHQDSGIFNISRGSQTSYGTVDSFVTTHQNHPFSRQDSHHHPRHGMSGHGQAEAYGSSGMGHQGQQGSVMVGADSMHGGSQQQGTVMMVYGLCSNRMNCDKLFNLFCLYGNVARIKFLRTKAGCAMVQMGDYTSVERCISSLNKVTIFGTELQLSYSKQAFLHEVLQPYLLPDGSSSFKDFTGNKNNRFKNPELASKNRISPPSSVLHFFNAPYGMTIEEMKQLFEQNSDEPVSIKFLEPKNNRNSSGFITFKDATESTEALILCNHLTIPRPHPHILRLCFSSPNQKSYTAVN